MRKLIRNTAFLVLAASAAVACGSDGTTPVTTDAAGTDTPPAEAEQTLVIGGGDIDHIDMVQFHSVSARLVMANVYSPPQQEVMEDDPDVPGGLRGTGEFSYGVTEGLELSEDGLTGTLRVRDGAKFASGEDITAEDLAYTMRRWLGGPGYTTSSRPYFGISDDVDGSIKIVDDRTVEVTFERASAMIDKVLAFTQFGIIDASVAEDNAGEDGWASEYLAKNATASGPYEIAEWVPGQYMELSRSDLTVYGPEAEMDTVRLQVIPDQSQRLLALKSGEIDIALEMPPDLLAEAAEDPELKVYSLPSSSLTYLTMHNEMAPLDNPVVREAISLAVPYEALVSTVMQGYGKRAGSPIPEPIEGSLGLEQAFETDVEAAKQLLTENGLDGVQVTLTVNAENAQHVQAATFIQDSLRQAGIDVNVQTLPGAEYTTRLNAGELQMSINSWYSYGEDPFYQLQFMLGTGAFTNYARYSNPELDELIAQGAASVDPEERAEIARQAQELVIADAPWAYLYTADHVFVTRKDISGITNTLDKVLRLQYIHRD